MKRACWLLVLAACGDGSSADEFPTCIGMAYDPCTSVSSCPMLPDAVCRSLVGSGSATYCTAACTGNGSACPANSVGEIGICREDGFCHADVGLCAPRM